MKSLIQSVEVTYFVHGTEDQGKVWDAVGGLLGGGAAPELERLEGHFGNEILKARVHLSGRDAQGSFERVVSKMPGVMKKEILDGLDSFLDEHSALYLRLDKQELVSGRVALGSGDPVRLRVKPRGYLIRGGAARFYAQIIGGA